MSPELHQRVRNLFEATLEKPESERPAFLEGAAAGDAELRQAVERLLAAHRNSDAFLAQEKDSDRRLGRYILNRELGRGSMGVVFEGVDPLIGRHVAVKVIRIDPSTETGQPGSVREQLFREARSAGSLLHPGIVVIFDVGQQGNAAFIAMELVEGPSLADLLDANSRPPIADSLEILRQAAAALDYAHRNGIVHRDIKPANIMLHKGSIVKIADFGVAKISTAHNLTAAGLILGTPTYMSPEQLEVRPLDGRSDQFSLAVVGYEMLTGSRPFEAPSLAPLTHQIVYGDRPSARAANPALSEAVDAVLRKALARLPEGRYATCSEFVTALSDAARQTPQREAAAAAPAPVPWVPPTAAQVADQPETNPKFIVAAPKPVVVPPVVVPPVVAPPVLAPPAAAAPVTPKSGAWIMAAVWILAGCLILAGAVAGGVWVYRSAPWKTLRAAGVAAPSVAPTAPPTAPAEPVATTPAAPAPAAAAPAAPSVERFTASARSLAAGGSATLAWEVKGATEVRIEPLVGKVVAAGSVSVQPAESTTYILSATGPGGQRSARVVVAVTPKAPAPTPPTSAKSLYEGGLAEQKVGHSDKALDLFRRAAEAGDIRAMLEVAEEGLDSDNGESERWFRKAAELGDSTAMLNLGAMYQLGNHLKEDYQQAAAWYRQAADKGNSPAMYNLARMYERGHGVPKDLAKAKELYQKAAARGNSDARIRLDQLTDK